MIYLLYGADSYSAQVFLDGLREAVGPLDVRDANITFLSAREATPAAILGMSGTVPFLAERRMVVVEGLLASLEGEGRRRGQAKESPAAQWRGFADRLGELPPSSDLVFHDGVLRATNPLLRELSPVADVHVFSPMRNEELRDWVRREADRRDGALTPGAARLLTDLVGPDLWALSNEVEKLILYAAGRPVGEDDVDELVSLARDANVFAAVDAVLAGDHRTALGLVHRLLQGDATVQYIFAMLARQVRLLILAQELIKERVSEAEAGRELGITSSYPLRKTMEQARSTPPASVRRLHAGLLETDIAIKTGALGETLALELLVARACTQMSRGRAAPTRRA